MTKTTRIVFLLISFAMPALARFGETEAQFASRYGRPHFFHNSRKFRGEDIPIRQVGTTFKKVPKVTKAQGEQQELQMGKGDA